MEAPKLHSATSLVTGNESLLQAKAEPGSADDRVAALQKQKEVGVNSGKQFCLLYDMF